MKWSLSSKLSSLKRLRKYAWPAVGLATVATFLVGVSRQAYSPIARKVSVKSDRTVSQHKNAKTPGSQTGGSSSASKTGSSAGGATVSASSPTLQTLSFTHTNIITTYFWVGEKASPDNGYIANDQSAWDENWATHFGGEDTPNARNGYYPAAFIPKENPFYFALPYSDIDDNGNRKASATNCPNYGAMKNQPYSWCKNSWVAIRKGSKAVYAQWQDTGPFEEDDTAYVFGSSAPKNKDGERAGLDVSPAVRGYLGLQDVDNCDWGFVSADSVPAGPWKQIVTTDPGDSI